MIFIQESDLATLVLVPRADGGRVVLDVFTDGRRTGCEVIQRGDWAARYKTILADGYIESDAAPDLIAVVDMLDCTVTFAGSIPYKLLNPSAGDLENPIDPLVVQADEIIASDFMRTTSWFPGGGDTRTAVVVPRVRTDIPPGIRESARSVIAMAVTFIRSQFDPTDPGQLSDWLVFTEEPLGLDFPRRIVEVVQQWVLADGAAPAVTAGIPAAIEHLHSALMAAHFGNIAACIEAADKVPHDLVS